MVSEKSIWALRETYCKSNDNRNKELTCSEEFSCFVMDELLPWVNENYNINNEESKNMIAGFSYGGLTVAFIAYKHPEVFSKVLRQSGGMFWNKEDDENEKRLILEMYENGERKPIDFYMTFGEFEKEFQRNYKANQDFYEILKNKKYNVEYKEFNGGHTYTDLDMEFGDGIIHLLGKIN